MFMTDLDSDMLKLHLVGYSDSRLDSDFFFFPIFFFPCSFFGAYLKCPTQRSCKKKSLKALCFTIKKNELTLFSQYPANMFIEGKLCKKIA